MIYVDHVKVWSDSRIKRKLQTQSCKRGKIVAHTCLKYINCKAVPSHYSYIKQLKDNVTVINSDYCICCEDAQCDEVDDFFSFH